MSVFIIAEAGVNHNGDPKLALKLIDAAAKAGISAVIEPGGSIRDDEVVAAANEHGMSLYFSGIRHFLH